MKKLKTIDLFSGCGGMSLGFSRANFNIIAAFENWSPAIDVYKCNFKHPIYDLDLGTVEARDIITRLNPDVVIGGPPCQDYSSAGPNNYTSDRANLVSSFVDIIEGSNPKYFVMENVPRVRLRPIFIDSINRLKTMGYGLTIKILDASYCGVPQIRKRLFLIGSRYDSDNFLEPQLNSCLTSEQLTMREYFGENLEIDYYFRVPTNYKRRGVFSIDEPSLTIRAVDRPIPKGYPRHPDDPVAIGPEVRGLTVLERSYIQTFPKTFVFKGSKTNLNKMIGNAVPVKLAEFVGNALMKYIEY